MYGWEGSEDGMKEIVKGVWLMRLCLFVVMIRTRDRREGTSRVMTYLPTI